MNTVSEYEGMSKLLALHRSGQTKTFSIFWQIPGEYGFDDDQADDSCNMKSRLPQGVIREDDHDIMGKSW